MFTTCSMELKEIITKMDDLRDELNALRPIPEDRLNRLNQKLRLDWNYHSNSIEGNTLSKSETRAFLLYGITAKGKPFRDYIEMKGHNEALKKLENVVHKDLNVTESLIKEFHRIILVEPFDSDAEINPGEYKTKPNYLYSPDGERIEFEPPEEAPRLLNELINWLNNHISPTKRKKKKYGLHPLLIAAGFHTRFIQIHPFGDGNGRIARIITNLILMLCGYVPAIIKMEERIDYYNSINLSTLEDPKPLAEFLGMECIKSLEMAIKAAKGGSIEEPDDLDKKLSLLKQEINNEDDENEIKTRLSVQEVKHILENWGYDLLANIAVRVIKFNEFYHNPRHFINVYFQDIGNGVNFIDNFKIEELNQKVESLAAESIDKAEIQLNMNFEAYKKGGLNPFGCHYTFKIQLDTYYYEVFIPYFDTNEKGQTLKSYTKRLLHKPLRQHEIKEIASQVGDILYQHLEYWISKSNRT